MQHTRGTTTTFTTTPCTDPIWGRHAQPRIACLGHRDNLCNQLQVKMSLAACRSKLQFYQSEHCCLDRLVSNIQRDNECIQYHCHHTVQYRDPIHGQQAQARIACPRPMKTVSAGQNVTAMQKKGHNKDQPSDYSESRNYHAILCSVHSYEQHVLFTLIQNSVPTGRTSNSCLRYSIIFIHQQTCSLSYVQTHKRPICTLV
jgi:hypothetical protein